MPEQERRTAHPPTELDANYHPVRNLSNRFLQDREEMRTRTWAGLGSYFYAHDGLATETAGPIQDRTQEHLGFGDKAIVAERLLLLTAIADVQAGRDPVGVIRKPEENEFDMVFANVEVPDTMDWRSHPRVRLRIGTDSGIESFNGRD